MPTDGQCLYPVERCFQTRLPVDAAVALRELPCGGRETWVADGRCQGATNLQRVFPIDRQAGAGGGDQIGGDALLQV
ncbi:MAG: hypothetical protein KDA41_06820, partial [Planctomycetales bacterium]|nr:hypothetical protein [Planctomycetales bacterium]